MDLMGRRFGELVVIGFSRRGKHNAKHWRCLCSCGKEVVIAQGILLRGRKSCGCLVKRESSDGTIVVGPGRRTVDLTGRVFGRLTVASFSHAGKRGAFYWNCACDCGNTVTVNGAGLVSGHSTSCGCARRVGRNYNGATLLTENGTIVRDIRGQRFGKLIVREYSHTDGRGSHWLVECDCGNVRTMRADVFRNGQCFSCGCGKMLVRQRREPYRQYRWFVTANGRRITMRSGYEVVVARYFLRHRIRFEYEPAAIVLPNHKRYVPDFYLPDLNTYVEVKGYMRPDSAEKIRLFRDVLHMPLITITHSSISAYLPSGTTYKSFLGEWRRVHGLR